MTEMMTLGIRIRTEFQKPTRIPSQVTPVQAEDHALPQASKLSDPGREKIEPVRISGMVFSEVISITNSGSAKNTASISRNA